jgi:hypothetical protein
MATHARWSIRKIAGRDDIVEMFAACLMIYDRERHVRFAARHDGTPSSEAAAMVDCAARAMIYGAWPDVAQYVRFRDGR